MCVEDLLWTEDDMDNFLHTYASFETHKRMWQDKREKRRRDRWHPDHGKPMPRMIPPSYVRLFQITLSQVHSAKFQQHFGAMAMDGTLYKPFSHMWKGLKMRHGRWLNQLTWRRNSSAGFSSRTPGWPLIPRPSFSMTPRT